MELASLGPGDRYREAAARNVRWVLRQQEEERLVPQQRLPGRERSDGLVFQDHICFGVEQRRY